LGSRKERKAGRRPGAARAALASGAQAFLVAALLVEPSLGTVSRVGLLPAAGIILAIVALGVAFDVVGVAAAAADEQPFHAMAAKRIPGARQAIEIVRRADRVATFTVDLVGEITAAISGAAGAAVVFRLASGYGYPVEIMNTLVIAGIAALTVAAKAAVKGVAIRRANSIVFLLGRLLAWASWRSLRRRLPSPRGKRKP